MESKLSEEQQKEYQEALTRGSDLEEMVKSRGWEWVKKYFQARVQGLANGLLLEDKKPITDFDNERRELIGLRKLIGSIESDIKTVENDRQKNKPVTKK